MSKSSARNPSRSMCSVAATGALALTLGACFDHTLEPIAPCVTLGSVETWVGTGIDKVDLLFMVDNSGSMSEEQASLGAELPRLVRVLTTGDRTGDGLTPDDFPPVRSLHLGVVTSDMGVAGFNVPTCMRAAMFGDDGLLRTMGNTSIAGCMASYPSFLEYVAGVSTPTPDDFGNEFRCIAMAGVRGCGFEQQLEATLKALTPQASPIQFFAGTRGHGDVENAGFLRPDSVIALVLVTDEEDCSIEVGSEDIFNQTSATFTGDLNLRCFLYKEAQWPVQRYIDGFKALRAGRESMLVFGAITGVPLDLVREGTPNYDAILADPRMVEQVDASPGGIGARLVPSCNVPGRGTAFPPRRIVEVARGFGAYGAVESICQSSFISALDHIVTKIARALDNALCLPEGLPRSSSGLIACALIETLPPPGIVPGTPISCTELGGVEPMPVRVNVGGSIECRVIQLATSGSTPSGLGWYYDDFSMTTRDACGDAGQRVAFTPGALPHRYVTLHLDCLERTPSGAPDDTTCVD